MKCKWYCPAFELESLIPLSMMITVILSMPPNITVTGIMYRMKIKEKNIILFNRYTCSRNTLHDI